MTPIALASAITLILAQATPAVEPAVLPLDTETQAGGLDVACTGFGADARAEPRWQTYGVRVEFSNARNEYLAGGTVEVRDAKGRSLLNVRCDAPWLLIRLPPGAYVIEGRVGPEAKPRSARVSPPAKGQMRVVLQFPEV